MIPAIFLVGSLVETIIERPGYLRAPVYTIEVQVRTEQYLGQLHHLRRCDAVSELGIRQYVSESIRTCPFVVLVTIHDVDVILLDAVSKTFPQLDFVHVRNILGIVGPLSLDAGR